MNFSKKMIKRIWIITMLILGLVTFIFYQCNRINEKKAFNALNPEMKVELSYNPIKEEDKNIDNCEYVQFSAFFTRDLDADGYADKLDGTCNPIDKKDVLYVEFNVLSQGYLENGEISLNMANNFTWNTSIVEDTMIKGNYIGETSKIVLQDKINCGSQKMIWGIISSKIGSNINDYSKINSITLTGTHVIEDENGNKISEIEISKTVNLKVDWYGVTSTKLICNDEIKRIDSIKSGEKAIVKFGFSNSETAEELIMQKQVAELNIPSFNEYEPINASANGNGVSCEYDVENKILKIYRESTVDQNGMLTTMLARENQYNVEIQYPLEAYEKISVASIDLEIPINVYNYGYNNSTKIDDNNVFDNPYISSATGIKKISYKDNISEEGYIWNLYTYVGEYQYCKTIDNYRYSISKKMPLNIYNGNLNTEKDEYPVEWLIDIGRVDVIDNIVLEEQKENDINKSDKFNAEISMYDLNKTTGVYFEGASSVLGRNGWIKLYNAETGELVENFTSANWNNYNKENPYNVDLKSIKIETSKPFVRGNFSVYQIKEIDDNYLTGKYTLDEFDNLNYIYTYLKGTIQISNGDNLENENNISSLEVSNLAYYDYPYSIQELTIFPEEISNQETKKVNLKISTSANTFLESKWKNGIFLIEFPREIINIDIESINPSIDDVTIVNYLKYKENGKYYLKIYTKNKNENVFDLDINAKLSGNPLIVRQEVELNLYSYNQNCDNYFSKIVDSYDVDDDNLETDYVGHSNCKLILTNIGTSGILTTEYITNFDDNEDNIVIAPNCADIDKSDNSKTAKVNLSITNNYEGTLSNISILGRTPFEGNTYVINNADMGSEFNANLMGKINVPNELEQYAKIYYTNVENANKNLADISNNWKTEEFISDWSSIKNYLIDLGDYVLPQSESKVFSYEIVIPNGIPYNKASYSNHAVYYCLDTTHGKLATATEPNKVGIQVVGKYKLELEKNKLLNDNILVSGAIFSLSTLDLDGKPITQIKRTDVNGKIVFDSVYIDRDYVLKEIAAPENYEILSDEIKFNLFFNSNGQIEFNVKEGIFKNIPDISLDSNGEYLVNVKLENKPKYNLQITKNKLGDNTIFVNNTTYKIQANDEEFFVGKTDNNGIVNFNGLTLNKEYELKEIIANKDFSVSNETIKFSAYQDENGALKFDVIGDNSFVETPVIETTNAGTDIVKVKLEDEAKYRIILNKKNENNEPLSDVKFIIRDDLKSRNYITNVDGQIVISDLEVGKRYELQEIKADGYYIDVAPRVFSIERENERLKINTTDELLSTAVVEENQGEILGQVSLEIRNEKIPTYKLQIIKVSEENEEEVLSGAKFNLVSQDTKNIYSLEDTNGITEIDNLYLHVDGKYVSGRYLLQETEAPEGYTNNPEEIYFSVTKDTNDNLSVNVEDSDKLTTFVDAKIENGVVKIKVKDRPLFKLTKVDSATGAVLANAEFIIYEILDNGTDYAKDPTGNYVGTKTENGDYVVKTDENGVIKLPLRNGDYVAVEITYPEGYQEGDNKEYFRVGEKEEVTENNGDDTNAEEENQETENNQNIVEINYIEDLVDLSKNVNSGNNYAGKNVKLMKSLDFNNPDDYKDSTSVSYGDLNGNGEVESVINELTNVAGCGFTPIGKDSSKCFSGLFNGNNNIIENIYIKINSKNIGFFGYIDGANVENLGISGYIENTATSSFAYTGGIVGYANSSQINDCNNNVEINARSTDVAYTGGIVGFLSISCVKNCYNNATIVSNTSGGIVGDSKSSDIINCYNIANLEGLYVGGIAGRIEYSNVICSYNTGKLYSQTTSNYVGGIASYSSKDGTIKMCYNSGDIEIDNSDKTHGSGVVTNALGGGIVGGSEKIYIKNCYNTGNISVLSDSSVVYNQAGGILGDSYYNSIIENCYNIGSVEAKNLYKRSDKIGGITIRNTNVSNSFYLNTCLGDASIIVTYYGEARSSDEMKEENFIEEFSEESFFKLDMNQNNGYPILKNVNELEKITQITWIEDLEYLSDTVELGLDYKDTNIILMKDLDFEQGDSYKSGVINNNLTKNNRGFSPIGKNNINSFEGIFDGNNKKISNLYIKLDFSNNYYSQECNAGLFGYIENAIIKNLSVSGNMNIVQFFNNGNIGSIVGYCNKNSQIINCSNNDFTINLKGFSRYNSKKYNYNVGGIVGVVKNNCTIDSCDNFATILYCKENDGIEEYYIGGIIGKALNNNVVKNNTNNGEFLASVNNKKYASINIGGILAYASNNLILENNINTANIGDLDYCRYIGGILGYSDNEVSIYSCSNLGNIKSIYIAGGILGKGNKVDINSCYNEGKIECNSSDFNVEVGGIAGELDNGSIKNVYNTGEIIGFDEQNSYSTIGGICGRVMDGYKTKVQYGYNIGNIIGNPNKKGAGYYKDRSCWTGGIVGYGLNNKTTEEYGIKNCYYLDEIDLIGSNIGEFGESKTKEFMQSKDMYNLINVDKVWLYRYNNYPLLLNKSLMADIQDSVELNIENTIKKFKITTDINEIDGVKGGTVSGEDEDAYEVVEYNRNNTKSIEIIPDEGYFITNISINGENIVFLLDNDGKYVIGESYFSNVKENKHIIVTFSSNDRTINIEKKNDSGEPLKDASFKVESDYNTFNFDESKELIPNGYYYQKANSDYEVNFDKELIPNGSVYGIPNKTQDVTNDVLGEKEDNESSYKFIENEEGILVSNNNGIHNSLASSYFKIDLSQKVGIYSVVVNANISSESTDVGYATICTTNNEVPERNNESGRFIYISGNTSSVIEPKDYISEGLEGGNIYYLYLCYYKDSSVNTGNDEFSINSINIYEATPVSYNFEENNGLYTPNNIDNSLGITVANSYIPIDLRDKSGKYFISLKATAKSNLNSEILKVAISENSYYSGATFVNMYNDDSSYVSNNLDGGKLYYLHMQYTNTSSDTIDTVQISNIKLYEAQTYKFIEDENGAYVSNNIGFSQSLANSYIEVDLTDYVGEYKLKVNAEFETGGYNDYGYITISEKTEIPAYGIYQNGFIYLVEQTPARDYETTLNAGKKYYIHIGNYLYSTYNSPRGLIINSINLEPIIDTYIEKTNEEGIASVGVKYFGKYKITEIEAPDGYALDDEPQYVEILPGENVHTLEFVNTRKSNLIVEHYLKGTNNKVAEDEEYKDIVGKEYTTSPRIDLEGLHLVKDNNGDFIIPENSSGVYTDDTTYVRYYYEPDQIKLTINHYLEGTENKLKDTEYKYTNAIVNFAEEGKYTILAEDIYDIDTNANYLDLLSSYNFAFVTSTNSNNTNIKDILSYNEDTEIDYYYSLKEFEIETEVKKHIENRINPTTNIKEDIEVEGGKISLANGENKEVVAEGYDSTQNIIVIPNENYVVKTITLESINEDGTKTTTIVYGENEDSNSEITYTLNSDGSIIISNFDDVYENKKVIVEFSPTYAKLVVHYYLENTGEEYNVTPIKVKTSEGVEVENLEQSDLIGEPYNAVQRNDIASNYEFISVSGEVQGIYQNETKNIYYYYREKEKNLSYIVKYLEKDNDEDDTNNLVLHEEKNMTGIDEGKIIPSSKEVITIPGYDYNSSDKSYLVVDTIMENNVITLYYTKSQVGYEVHYFYDGIEDTTEKEESTATYKDIITYQDVINNFGDKVKDGYGLENCTPVDSNNELKLEISADSTNNIINIYYRTQFKIETEVVEHEETSKDETIKNVKGGKVFESTNTEYEIEKVFKGDDSVKSIIIKPDVEYEIFDIKVTDSIGTVTLNLDQVVDTNGNVTLNKENGFFTDVNSDKKVEVEFRKKSNVIIKYLSATEVDEEGKPLVLVEENNIIGYDSKEFNAGRKPITYYQESAKGITDENGSDIDSYNRIELDSNGNIKGTMYSDTLTIIYWYERIPSGIVIRHIEITEEDIRNGLDMDSGIELESETLSGFVSLEEITNRKVYDKYFAVDGPESDDENIIITNSDDIQKIVKYKDSEIVEVRYYYEKQYIVKTTVTTHDENGTEVKGGTITKADEEVNQSINKYGENSEVIVVTPDYGYMVKSLIINGENIDLSTFEEDENHIIKLDVAYFKNVDNDINISVEFEKIPAKIITKFVDIDTEKEIAIEEITTGFVGDKYITNFKDINGYGILKDKTLNANGQMTEDDIIVIYYYKKQFQITTDVIEHEEIKRTLIEVPSSKKSEIEMVKVKGGSITGEDEKPYEIVLRGEDSKKQILLTPEEGYRIISVTVNGNEVKIDDENGFILANFEDIKEDLHIEVKYEKISAKIIVKYIEKNTGGLLAPDETDIGNVGDNFKTNKKQFDSFELIDVFGNEEGILVDGDNIVIYYYQKIINDDIIENGGIISKEENGGIKTDDKILLYLFILITMSIVLVITNKKRKNN